MQEIEITIDLEGSTQIDLKGFHGKGCSEITDKLIKALEGNVVSRSPKTEYYKPKVQEKVIQRRRL